MKRFTQLITGLLATTVIVLGLSTTSFAAASNADAGDTISNRATLSYFVGAVSQPVLESSPAGNTTGGAGNGADTNFTVDHKVRAVVASAGNTVVIPGSNDRALRFTVTNDGNTDSDSGATLDIQLIAQQLTADNFNMASVRIFIDDDGTPGLNILTDSNITASPVISLARDVSADIYVVGNTPAGVLDSQTADVVLIATAFETGAIMAETGAPTAGVDKVFADDAGTSTNIRNDATNVSDVAFDGVHSATGSFVVGSVNLSVAKTSSVIYDPIGGGFHVPGAYVQYVITIANAAGASQSALLTNISDTLNANLNLDPDLLTAGGIPESAAFRAVKIVSGGTSTRATAAAATYHTGDIGDGNGDGVSYTGGAGGNLVVNLNTVLPIEGPYVAGELKPGESVTITFNVLIQ